MTEEESTNSDWIQIDFENLQKNLVEEKEKTVKLENELKEMNKKIEKINCDNENKIEGMKQNFQKLIEENIKQLKAEYDVCLKKKDEKINSLEEEIIKITFDNQKLIEEKFQQLKTDSLKHEKNQALEGELKMNFVKIKNKWSEIDDVCCENKCINSNNPIGKCAKGNGFVNLTSAENISWVKKIEVKNTPTYVYAENPFRKPQYCLNYSLYYYEIKCIFGGNSNTNAERMSIGLENCSTENSTEFYSHCTSICNENDEAFKLLISFNNNDIFGCGLVYPPTNLTNEFPYIFFTKNGKQIGKGILLKEYSDSYQPHVWLKSCSVEANFGDDLETKPFTYDISKHTILKEFY